MGSVDSARPVESKRAERARNRREGRAQIRESMLERARMARKRLPTAPKAA
jgi:hypothetical protein